MNVLPASNYIIFAAGIGSRMNADFPKFLVDIDGHGVFEYQLAQLAKFPGCIYIVCGYRADVVCDRICNFISTIDSFEPQVCFVYNPEYNKTQVTSIRRALDSAPHDRPTFLIDGDMLFTQQTIESLHSERNTTVVLRRDVSRDAVVANVKNARLVTFKRSDVATHGPETVEWANIAKYQPPDVASLSDLSSDSSIPHHFELINRLIASGREVCVHEDRVAEIDQPEDLAAAVEFARQLE